MAAPPNMSAALAAQVGQIKNFEKNIAYMYLDTTHNVTVGYGHNVTSHGDCQSLPFKVQRFERKPLKSGAAGTPITQNKVVGRAATATEKQNDYDFLINSMSATNPQGLGIYAADNPNLHLYTTVELDQSDREATFWSDLSDAWQTARSACGQNAFDSFPVPCQAGLVDVAFNTGHVDNKLKNAAKGTGQYAGKPASERWQAAATLSVTIRPQADETRKNEVKNWFLAGATEAKAKEDAAKEDAAKEDAAKEDAAK